MSTPSPDTSGAVERRMRAAMAGHLGRAGEARHHLHDRDPAVRATALRALSRAGDLGSEELSAALSDAAASVRVAALELAARRTDVSAESLADRLRDDDARVVETAAWACGERIDREAVSKLARVAADHEDALCRESAIAALGAIGDPGGLPAVLAGLNDKPAVRRRSVISLAPFNGPEVEAALERAGRDRDRQVRAAAAELQPPAQTP